MNKKIISLLLALLLVLSLGATALAEPAGTEHVADLVGLLSPQELSELELIASLGEDYDCGIYIVTLEDFEALGFSTVDDACIGIYEELELGIGPEHDGIILLLSMAERDYAFYSHGHLGNAVKNPRFYDSTLEGLLEYLGEDQWYGGFYYFVNSCLGSMQDINAWLEENPDASLEDYGNMIPMGFRVGGVILCFALAAGLAFLIIAVLKRQLKSVYSSQEADDYIQGGLNLSSRFDTYTHTTETRTYSPESKNDSSSSSSSGGYSGGSGKF